MKIKNISKILIIFILSLTNLEAGFIMNKIKDKAKDKVKDVTVCIYRNTWTVFPELLEHFL